LAVEHTITARCLRLTWLLSADGGVQTGNDLLLMLVIDNVFAEILFGKVLYPLLGGCKVWNSFYPHKGAVLFPKDVIGREQDQRQ
jgi:hypothetical protein